MAEKNLRLKVESQQLKSINTTASYHLVANSKDYVSMTIELPETVNEGSIVEFYFNRRIKKQATVTIEENTKVVTLQANDGEETDKVFPSEVLKEPGFTISIIYSDLTNEITTDYVFYPVYTNGIGEEPLVYDDDTYIDARIARDAAEEALLEISQLNDQVENLSEDISARTPRWGNTAAVYINDETGDDNNNGTEAHPFKTVDRAIKYANSENGATSCNFIFMTSGIYRISDKFTIKVGSAIHFLNYNLGIKDGEGLPVYSVPTILFDRLATRANAARAYSSYLHLEGAAVKTQSNTYKIYPIKIDCTHGSIYFEHCALTLKFVDFLCPVSFIHDKIRARWCSFTDGPNSNYQLELTDCTGQILEYVLFKGSQCLPMHAQASTLELSANLYLAGPSEIRRNLYLHDSSKLSQQIILLEHNSQVYIDRRMIAEYYSDWNRDVTQSTPYVINSNNQLFNGISYGGKKSGSEIDEVFNSYTYLLFAKASYINTVRSFFINVNRLTGTGTDTYYTDKLYADHTILMADGVSLNPDYPEKFGNYDYYMAQGYITNSGNDLYLTFNLPGSISDRRYFPRIYIDQNNYWIRGTDPAVLSTLKTTLDTFISNGVLLNNVNNGEFNPLVRFTGSQVLVKITLSTSFPTLNNTPLLFMFQKLGIRWVNNAPVSTGVSMYSDHLQTTVITELSAGQSFSVLGWQSTAYRYGTTESEGATYSGYIPVTTITTAGGPEIPVLPS